MNNLFRFPPRKRITQPKQPKNRAADAALREAEEEVALDRREARVLGYLPAYFTGSNYLITPVVAMVEPSRPLVPNPAEVRSVFEVPLGWLMEAGNFGTYRIRRDGKEHTTWQILHGELVIWGITANITRRFHDLAPVIGFEVGLRHHHPVAATTSGPAGVARTAAVLHLCHQCLLRNDAAAPASIATAATAARVHISGRSLVVTTGSGGRP